MKLIFYYFFLYSASRVALKLLTCIKLGVGVQTRRRRSPLDGVRTWRFWTRLQMEALWKFQGLKHVSPAAPFRWRMARSVLLPLQSPCRTCSQLLPALKLQTFLVHLTFYIERWKYILVICGKTIMPHAGKIVFMVPAGKQVHEFQSTTVLLFLRPSFASWSDILRTSCPHWVEPGFLPSLK